MWTCEVGLWVENTNLFVVESWGEFAWDSGESLWKWVPMNGVFNLNHEVEAHRDLYDIKYIIKIKKRLMLKVEPGRTLDSLCCISYVGLNVISWNQLTILLTSQCLTWYWLTIYAHMLILICLVIHIRWHTHKLHWCPIQSTKHPLSVIHSCLKQIHPVVLKYFNILVLNKLHLKNNKTPIIFLNIRTQLKQTQNHAPPKISKIYDSYKWTTTNTT